MAHSVYSLLNAYPIYGMVPAARVLLTIRVQLYLLQRTLKLNVSGMEAKMGRGVCSTMKFEGKHWWTDGTTQWTATLKLTDAQGKGHVLATWTQRNTVPCWVMVIFIQLMSERRI